MKILLKKDTFYHKVKVDIKDRDSIKKIIQAWIDEIELIKKECESKGSFDLIYVDLDNESYEFNDESKAVSYSYLFDIHSSQYVFWNAALKFPELKELYSEFIKKITTEIKDTYETMANEDGFPLGLFPAYLLALKYPDCIPLFQNFIGHEGSWQLNGQYQCYDALNSMKTYLDLK